MTECSPSHSSDTGHGANTAGPDNPYQNTCEQEHAPGNGKGDGAATGKPCAGCVGNADDKNPPGQAPGGSDDNAGYECDRNEGVGKENPAHTGCADGETGDGDVEPGGGSQQPVCPAGAAAMTDHEFALDGSAGDIDDVTPGDTVKATFTIAAGCNDIVVSLASYGADRKLSDSDSDTFDAGVHTLEVDTPDCATEVDFVFGGVVNHLGAAEGSPYGDQGRLIDAGNGAVSCPSTPSSNDTPDGGSNGTPSDVLGTAISATAGTPAVTANVIPAEVLGVQLTPAAAASNGTTNRRPAEVLGVQYERPAAGLALTGSGLLPIAALGGALCLVGFGLVARNREDQNVSVAARLAGYGVAA